MAVYTDIQEEALKSFLLLYDIGSLSSLSGIAEGVENSNFLLKTTQGTFILTLFEQRMNPQELPWFMGLMGHLASRDIACPLPIKARDGQVIHTLAGRPAVIVSFLQGRSLEKIDADACEQAGRALARLHQAGQGYKAERVNTLGPKGWVELLSRCTDGGDKAVSALITNSQNMLGHIVEQWPQEGSLPRGHIHADLFVDNVFFENEKLSGVIDFYFACTDFLAYDLAICLNAWCFIGDRTYQYEWAKAMLRGYEQVRPLLPEERAALPILCQGAAMRFLLTRLYDWVNTPKDALVTRKDPWAYQNRLQFFQKGRYV